MTNWMTKGLEYPSFANHEIPKDGQDIPMICEEEVTFIDNFEPPPSSKDEEESSDL